MGALSVVTSDAAAAKRVESQLKMVSCCGVCGFCRDSLCLDGNRGVGLGFKLVGVQQARAPGTPTPMLSSIPNCRRWRATCTGWSRVQGGVCMQAFTSTLCMARSVRRCFDGQIMLWRQLAGLQQCYVNRRSHTVKPWSRLLCSALFAATLPSTALPLWQSSCRTPSSSRSGRQAALCFSDLHMHLK